MKEARAGGCGTVYDTTHVARPPELLCRNQHAPRASSCVCSSGKRTVDRCLRSLRAGSDFLRSSDFHRLRTPAAMALRTSRFSKSTGSTPFSVRMYPEGMSPAIQQSYGVEAMLFGSDLGIGVGLEAHSLRLRYACSSFPLAVKRYFCLLLRVFSGMVISMRPSTRAGCK